MRRVVTEQLARIEEHERLADRLDLEAGNGTLAMQSAAHERMVRREKRLARVRWEVDGFLVCPSQRRRDGRGAGGGEAARGRTAQGHGLFG